MHVTSTMEVAKVDVAEDPTNLQWKEALRVDSFKGYSRLVVLIIDGQRFAVSARDLIAAVTNATNTSEG